MSDRGGLARTMVARSITADRRTAVLSAGLAGLPVAFVIAASPWVDALGPAWFVVAGMVWVALAVGEPARAAMGAQLWINGGRAGTRVALVLLQALALGAMGTAAATVAGLAVALPGALATDGNLPSIAWLAGAVASGLAGALAAGLVSSLRAVRAPSLPALEARTPAVRVRWWWILLCAAMLWRIARSAPSTTFWDFNLVLALGWPLLVVGTVGLTSAALRAAAGPGRWATGPSWFALRTVGRDRRRTGPIAGFVAVVVGACAVGALFQASFAEREARAERRIEAGVHESWMEPDEGFPAIHNLPPHVREALERSGTLAPRTDRRPRPVDVETLGRSSLIPQHPRDRWLLALAAALVLVPAVGISVALSASARRRDDALIALQGAGPGWTRWTNAIEASVMTAVGTVMGVGLALATVAYGFSVYNGGVRHSVERVYPPVPFVAPWWELAALIVLLPPLAGLLSAWLTPRDDAAGLGRYAEASAPTPAL